MRDCTRVLLVTIAPPRNDCGVRVVLHRHLVERRPFAVHVVSNADFAEDLLVQTPLRLPYLIHRLRKSRLGPRLKAWILDFENLVWSLTIPRKLERAILHFEPNVILTLAETGLCHIASNAARRHRLPQAGLFLDWFPFMKDHYGHAWTKNLLSRRYRALYRQCDLALCTSDGMREELGPHPNSHVVYPMPGRHSIPKTSYPPPSGKFRLVYVGSVENFYGRMICSLIKKISGTADLEFIVVGPNADWPAKLLEDAKAKGIYLGFMAPEEAAKVLSGADALLVAMSFEKEHEMFMRTSFTTKFLDYCSFNKPIILWGPKYCAPWRVAKREGGALTVAEPSADAVVTAMRQLIENVALRTCLIDGARRLSVEGFNPDRLQGVLVSEIEKLAKAKLAGKYDSK